MELRVKHQRNRRIQLGTIIATALVTFGLAALVACGNSSPSSNVVPAANAYGFSPSSAACFQSAAYTGPVWNQYQSIGMMPYPGTAPIATEGLCACGPGFVPACGPNVGMMCVPVEVIRSYSFTPGFYSWGARGFRFNTFIAYGTDEWHRHFEIGVRQGDGRGGFRPGRRPLSPRTGSRSAPGQGDGLPGGSLNQAGSGWSRSDRTAGRGRGDQRRRQQIPVAEIGRADQGLDFEAAKAESLGLIESINTAQVVAVAGGVCTTQIAQTCLLNMPSQPTCGFGSCHPVQPGSNVGICGQ